MSHVFGPVPSRRLGRSLGVDLVPFKTCSYNCIYCQLGATTELTVAPRQDVTPAVILAELPEKLALAPDYITLSGSGEPTLYAPLGELIAGIRALTDIPVAVITNGSLLWRPEVRAALRQAHLLVPSLDAGDPETFAAVNRPHPSLDFGRMLDGLVACRREFPGQYWLEVFLLAGVNDDGDPFAHLVDGVRRIGPDRVQLNTATRPTAEAAVRRVPADRLAALAPRFAPPAEVIADFRHVHDQPGYRADAAAVLDLLRRRPCTLADIAAGLGMHRHEALKHLTALEVAGNVRQTRRGEAVYYAAADTSSR